MIRAFIPPQPEPLKRRRILSRIGNRRLNVLVDKRASEYLKRLSEEYSLTESKALTMVLHEHEDEMLRRKAETP